MKIGSTAKQQNITYAQAFANHSNRDTLLGIIETAKQGNALLREWFAKVQAGDDVGAVKKGSDFEHFGFDDVFTQADVESQTLVIEGLKKLADIPIEAEEDDEHRCDMSTLPVGAKRWLIDPIDGTFCFKQGIPDFSITIAMQEKQADGSWKTEVGCVSDPMNDQVFIADGKAAHLITGQREKRLLLIAKAPGDKSKDDVLRASPKIDVVVFSRDDDVFDKLRWPLLEKLEALGGGTLTFSTALFISRLADGWHDGVILAADGLEFDWDTKAAIHIAEKAGAQTVYYHLGEEPVCLIAKHAELLSAMRELVDASYDELMQADKLGAGAA